MRQRMPVITSGPSMTSPKVWSLSGRSRTATTIAGTRGDQNNMVAIFGDQQSNTFWHNIKTQIELGDFFYYNNY